MRRSSDLRVRTAPLRSRCWGATPARSKSGLSLRILMTSVTAAARPMPKPGILDIAPYIPGRSGAKGQKVHKLSANESPLGASPKAIAAYRGAAQEIEFYPDGSARELRDAIATRYGLKPENIVCGA